MKRILIAVGLLILVSCGSSKGSSDITREEYIEKVTKEMPFFTEEAAAELWEAGKACNGLSRDRAGDEFSEYELCAFERLEANG